MLFPRLISEENRHKKLFQLFFSPLFACGFMMQCSRSLTNRKFILLELKHKYFKSTLVGVCSSAEEPTNMRKEVKSFPLALRLHSLSLSLPP